MASDKRPRALWLDGPERPVLRPEAVPDPGADEVTVAAHYGAVSRGTETLVYSGTVPESEYARMRAPFQAGDFPGPVKYGYATAGEIVAGPAARLGERVFCLHPHQERFTVPAAAARPIPAGVPTRRAVLAANMETALNAVWDAGCAPAERISVVGCGVVGSLVARLAARLPGADVEAVDTNPARQARLTGFGARFAEPAAASGARDVVLHASAHPDGLRQALALAGFEARVVELSWYGTREVTLPLGRAFHSQRLRLISSQVGTLAPRQRGRWDLTQRLDAALALLADDSLDALLAPATPFAQLPNALPEMLNDQGGQAPVIAYPPTAGES